MLTTFAGSYADYQAWLRTVLGTHERRIAVTVLDLNHQELSTLTPKFLEGEMTVDVDRDVSRVVTLKLLDPSRSLQFEPDSASDIPLQFRRMVRVDWLVRVPELNRWVRCPVFTGRLSDFDREGAMVSITAEGKERLSLGQAGRGDVYPKKAKKTDVITRLLKAGGETRLSIPDLPATTPEKITVRTMDSRWPIAKKLASSQSRQLFYNAVGRAVLRRPPGKHVFTFDARTLASEVSVDRDPSGLRNRWIVLGKKPDGAKKRVGADLRLPPKHSLSPQQLGPTDGEFFLIEQIENSKITTNKEAGEVARDKRDDSLRTLVSYSFDSLPIPHLEENDLVRVVTDEGTFMVRMKQWTLPFGLEGAPTMSVGSLQRKSVPLGRAKGHKGGKKSTSRYELVKGF